MRAIDRSIRFVFDSVADTYASGRPELPLEAVRDAAAAVGLEAGARVLEIGAGAGQLTAPLVAAGLDVVALEPGAHLRPLAAGRAPAAQLRPETFEEVDPTERFAAVFSANAFHWVDPELAYAKAAEVADALVLLRNTPYPANADLFRRVQHEVLQPRGSTFPDTDAGVRAFFEEDAAEAREAMRASGHFDEPWWGVYERRYAYSGPQYVDFVVSLGGIAASPERDVVRGELERVVGDGPVELVDLGHVTAARARRD